MPYAKNKGASQPAHPRSLTSTFDFRCLDSIISLVSSSKISSRYLHVASVAAQAGLCLTWKTGFLVTRLNYILYLPNFLTWSFHFLYINEILRLTDYTVAVLRSAPNLPVYGKTTESFFCLNPETRSQFCHQINGANFLAKTPYGLVKTWYLI